MKSRGFTLIELLVVVAIIGVLAAVVINTVRSARTKASVAFVKSSLNQIRTQASLYYANNGNYSTGTYSFETFLASAPTLCGNTCFLDDPIILNSIKQFDPHVGAYYDAGHPNQAHYMSYIISADKQRWAIAVSMLSGPRTYCIDSSGASVATGRDQYATLNGGDGFCQP